ncbi:MAG: PaaI family thioesterase [Proteobacteria bacterium]|nr:PaaI family thioesterase [Pseudomonadota bacterium]
MSTRVPLPAHVGCYVCGTPDDDRIRVCYAWSPETDELLAEVRFGLGAQGPPLHAHGGSVAAVLDEAMGTCAWMHGHAVVAVHLDIDFRELVPLDQPLEARCGVERVEGRKVHTRGTLVADDGRVLTQARGIFVVVRAEKLQGFLPEALDHLSPVERYIVMHDTRARRASPPR